MCVLGCKYVCAKSVNVGSPGKKKKKKFDCVEGFSV